MLAILWARIPLWLKIAAAIILAVPAVYQFGRWMGAKDARVAAQMEAIKEASSRISNMEKNNADFRSKSARDRCLVLMRDSGLPDGGCD
jgi:hypothetical protein